MKTENFFNFTLQDLHQNLARFGKEKFRSEQLYKWVFEKKITDFDQMTNLSKDFREELKKKFHFHLPEIKTHLISRDGTQKFLFSLASGKTVEAVVIPSDDRLTLCVSSEVGCNMACDFCFTGKQKLKQRLDASEIVGQFLKVEEAIAPLRLTNIVFMGMGEPLDNPDAVFKSVEILHSPFGRQFSKRKVTVSTSGLVPEIPLVAQAGVRLAVSLNAPNDEIRNQIMPINKKFPLKDLLKACEDHYRASRDKITFEYVLLKGVTDHLEHARELVRLVRRVPCKINIIPFNEHPGSEYQRPTDQQVEKFHSELIRLGAHVLLRRTMGRDIYAACGQLTSEIENKPIEMDTSNSRIGGLHKRFFENPDLSS